MNNVITAMKKGQEVGNPAAFKNASTLAGAIGSLLAIGFSLARIIKPEMVAGISDDDVVKISGFLAGGVMAVMGIVNIISSKKVGFGEVKRWHNER